MADPRRRVHTAPLSPVTAEQRSLFIFRKALHANLSAPFRGERAAYDYRCLTRYSAELLRARDGVVDDAVEEAGDGEHPANDRTDLRQERREGLALLAVSYTHLTLPTILLV